MTHPRIPRMIGGAALVVALAVGGAAGAAAEGDDGPGQVIDPNQQQGSGQVVRSAGHVDFGPTLGTGQWALQIHDDTQVPRYWRDPDEVVLQVSDAAVLTVPDDDAFAFLQLPAGTPVHVIPQTEQQGVIWAGSNTQEPNVLENLNLGATLRINAIEGPGDVIVYLQGGNLGQPQQLWSTHEPFPQDAWIEVNTHTHANWVFSAPGVYLVEAEFVGDLVDGTQMDARGVLRFAVGDATDPAAAFAATLSEPAASAEPEASAEGSADTDAADADAPAAADMTVWSIVIAAAVVLAVVVIVVTVRSARARRRARTAGGAGS